MTLINDSFYKDNMVVVDLGAIIHILTVRRTTIRRKHVQTGERDGKDGWKKTARRNVENVVEVVVDVSKIG